MNILLTGITGFIGRHLSTYLSNAGHSVLGIIRPASISHTLDERSISFVYDGTFNSILNAFEKSKPDIVIHLATLYRAAHMSNDLEVLVHSNILLGTFLLEAMKTTGCGAIINVGTRWQHQDDKPYSPVNLYSATKQAYTCILEYYASAYALKCMTLELSDTYGPGDTRGKIVDLLASALVAQRQLDLSPGEQLLDLIYIDDVCDAFKRGTEIIEKSTPGSVLTYTISSGDQISLREIGSIAEDIFQQHGLFNWGAKDYRVREAMQPYFYYPLLPDWKPIKTMKIRLVDYFKHLKSNSLVSN